MAEMKIPSPPSHFGGKLKKVWETGRHAQTKGITCTKCNRLLRCMLRSVQKWALCASFLGGDIEELNMLNKRRWNELTCSRFGCRLGCHLGWRFSMGLGFGRGLGRRSGRKMQPLFQMVSLRNTTREIQLRIQNICQTLSSMHYHYILPHKHQSFKITISGSVRGITIPSANPELPILLLLPSNDPRQPAKMVTGVRRRERKYKIKIRGKREASGNLKTMQKIGSPYSCPKVLVTKPFPYISNPRGHRTSRMQVVIK